MARLENLTMQELASVVRGEQVSGIADDGIGEYDAYEDSDDEDDVEGIDDSDIGAVKRKARRARPNSLKRNVWRGRKVLGIGSTSVAAGATADIDVSPLHIFKAQRFVATGTGLVIQNITVQGRQQFESSDGAPIDVFSGAGSDLNFVFDECPPNGHIVVTVANPTGGAVTLTGAFLGLVR